MILEAFSHVLKQHYTANQSATRLLHAWLHSHLNGQQGNANCPVNRVLLAELELFQQGDHIWFEARSQSGERLLRTLYDYCHAYEDWQYRRWLHHVRASDFNNPGKRTPSTYEEA